MQRKRMTQLIVIPLLLILASLMSGCSQASPGRTEKTETLMGASGTISVYSDDEPTRSSAVQEAFVRVHEIDQRMSYTLADSQISQINSAVGKSAVTVTDDTLYLIEEGLRYHNLTEGAFHIGLGSLIELWGIEPGINRIPEPEAIKGALHAIDIETINLSGDQVFIRENGTAIHLGGMARGYAVDEAVRILRDRGLRNGIVNFGGDVYALGHKQDGSPWAVGIKEPVAGSFDLAGRVLVSDRSVVTAGDSERYAVDETGRHYHHILDPTTGYPSNNELVSVTIVSDTALKGDLISTAVFVMGLEKGTQLIMESPHVEGILITSGGDVHLTPGIIEHFELLNDTFTVIQ
jgi:FAD:protein FMN transferase